MSRDDFTGCHWDCNKEQIKLLLLWQMTSWTSSCQLVLVFFDTTRLPLQWIMILLGVKLMIKQVIKVSLRKTQTGKKVCYWRLQNSSPQTNVWHHISYINHTQSTCTQVPQLQSIKVKPSIASYNGCLQSNLWPGIWPLTIVFSSKYDGPHACVSFKRL